MVSSVEVGVSRKLRADAPLDAKFGPYADLSARDAIPADERYLGMLASVEDIGGAVSDVFALKNGIGNGDWQSILASSSVSGNTGEVIVSTGGSSALGDANFTRDSNGNLISGVTSYIEGGNLNTILSGSSTTAIYGLGSYNMVAGDDVQLYNGSWNFILADLTNVGSVAATDNFISGDSHTFSNVASNFVGGTGMNFVGMAASANMIGGQNHSGVGTGTIAHNLISGFDNHIGTGATLIQGSVVTGMYTDIQEEGIFAHGHRISGTGRMTASGKASIFMSAITSAQTAGHGTLAEASGIFGGQDHNIPADSLRSVVLGGNAIKATAATTDTVFMPKVVMGRGTSGSLPTVGETHGLGYDSATGDVISVPFSRIAGVSYDGDNNHILNSDPGNRKNAYSNMIFGRGAPSPVNGSGNTYSALYAANNFMFGNRLGVLNFMSDTYAGAVNFTYNTMVGHNSFIYTKTPITGDFSQYAYYNTTIGTFHKMYNRGGYTGFSLINNSTLIGKGHKVDNRGGYNYDITMAGGSYNTVINAGYTAREVTFVGLSNYSKTISANLYGTVFMPKLVIGRGSYGTLPTAGETHGLGYKSSTGEVIRTALPGPAAWALDGYTNLVDSRISHTNYAGYYNTIIGNGAMETYRAARNLMWGEGGRIYGYGGYNNVRNNVFMSHNFDVYITAGYKVRYSSIIGGKDNKFYQSGNHIYQCSILGGNANLFQEESYNSTIIGGAYNVMDDVSYSAIISTKNFTLDENYTVAMPKLMLGRGSNATITGSFSNVSKTLGYNTTTGEVFAVPMTNGSLGAIQFAGVDNKITASSRLNWDNTNSALTMDSPIGTGGTFNWDGSTGGILTIYNNTSPNARVNLATNTSNAFLNMFDSVGTQYTRLTTDASPNASFMLTGLALGSAATPSGVILSTTGQVRMSGLPTGTGGLSTGDLWNDGGTIKIV